MSNILPNLESKCRVYIICEGFEEYEYFNKLKVLKVFNDFYDFSLVNAESNGRIPSAYDYYFKDGSYDIVLAFCDTDRVQKDYELIKQKINDFHNSNIASDVVIFANPCTMQIILSHFSIVSLKTQNKRKNSKLIEDLTKISKYDARRIQRDSLFKLINKVNYMLMKINLSDVSTDEKVVPSTNFLVFAQRFENNKCDWVDKINKKIRNSN